MTALFLLLAFCLGLFVFSMVAYKKYRKFIVAMAYSEKCRLFCICLTGILIIGFHLVYYAAQPHDMGIMISTIFFCITCNKAHVTTICIYQVKKKPLYSTGLGHCGICLCTIYVHNISYVCNSLDRNISTSDG